MVYLISVFRFGIARKKRFYVSVSDLANARGKFARKIVKADKLSALFFM
jgi:hypothetical protein